VVDRARGGSLPIKEEERRRPKELGRRRLVGRSRTVAQRRRGVMRRITFDDTIIIDIIVTNFIISVSRMTAQDFSDASLTTNDNKPS
jgi:hypothetical protein